MSAYGYKYSQKNRIVYSMLLVNAMIRGEVMIKYCWLMNEANYPGPGIRAMPTLKQIGLGFL